MYSVLTGAPCARPDRELWGDVMGGQRGRIGWAESVGNKGGLKKWATTPAQTMGRCRGQLSPEIIGDKMAIPVPLPADAHAYETRAKRNPAFAVALQLSCQRRHHPQHVTHAPSPFTFRPLPATPTPSSGGTPRGHNHPRKNAPSFP